MPEQPVRRATSPREGLLDVDFRLLSAGLLARRLYVLSLAVLTLNAAAMLVVGLTSGNGVLALAVLVLAPAGFLLGAAYLRLLFETASSVSDLVVGQGLLQEGLDALRRDVERALGGSAGGSAGGSGGRPRATPALASEREHVQRVLDRVRDAGPATRHDLAQALQMTPQGVSGALRELSSAGLVAPDPDGGWSAV